MHRSIFIVAESSSALVSNIKKRILRCGSEYNIEKEQIFPTKTRKSSKWIKSNDLSPFGKYTELIAKPAVMK